MFSSIEDATWSVIGDYINSVSPVAHQIESYDHFIENQLPYIISEGSDISYMHSSGKVSHHVHFTNPSVNRPAIQESDGFYKPITPHIARLRGLTYSSTVVVDVIHDRINHTVSPPTLINRKVFRNVIIAQIPVMVRSKLCYLADVSENDLSADAKKHECKVDPGGYFIISGNEKTLIPQTKIRTNHVFIFPSKHGEKHKYTAEVRSCHEAKLRSTSTIYMNINDISNGEVPVITCKLPFLKSNLSVFILFRMLGAESTDDIINYIGNIPKDTEAILRIMLDSDTKQNYSRDAIMDWVGRNVTSDTTRATKESREKYIDHIITSELAPHMGLVNNPETNKKKMIFIGHMIQRLMSVATGQEVVDDRDDFINKRIDSAGALLALLLRQHHRGNAMQGLSTQLRKQVESPREATFNVGEIVSHKKITSGLKFAFATGTWGISRGGGTANGGQTGVVQILPRLTTMATLGASRKINTPIAREGRTAGPRMLHPSSWGLVCCSDTPEGQACGLVSNLAMTTRIRIGAPMQPIAILLMTLDHTIDISTATSHERYIGYALHVNGTIVGYAITIDQIKEIATQMRSLRRHGNLPFDCSISISNDNSLFVNSDHGALLRPLIIRDRYHDFVCMAMQNPAVVPNKYTRMLREGIIEYIDSAEQTNMRVAIHHTDIEQDEYTHIEIHPALLTGICVSQIPFCDHNQSPRIAYQAAQCKQAIGLYTTNFAERLDTVGHVLATPQKPLVTTRLEELLGTSVVRSGAVPIVAIMCYSGFNQDDSVLLNQSSIDRGLFTSFAYHTIRDEEKGTGADIERFENPKNIPGCSGMKEADYSKIDDKGMPIIGKTFYNGDVLIGKVVSMSLLQADPKEGEVRRDTKRDRSHVLRTDEPVVVDAVFFSKTPEGHGYVKVRTRAIRIPMVGDKFCLTADHEVLTKDGWKYINNVTPDDHALTYDPVSESISYEQVQETMTFSTNNTEMYNISNSSIDLTTTMEHKMYVQPRNSNKFQLLNASSIIGKRVRYKKACENGLSQTHFDSSIFNMPIYNNFETDILWLIGFFIGDGWTETGSYECPTRTKTTKRINIYQVKPHTRQKCINICKRIGYNPIENGDKIHIYNITLYELLKPISIGAKNKYIPHWAKFLNIEQSRALLQGLIDSDGSVNASNVPVYYTSSTRLRDDVMQVVLHAGYSSTYSVHTEAGTESVIRGRKIMSTAINWRVSVIQTKNTPQVNHGHVHQQNVQHESITTTNDPVHCISVRTGIFYVRRNGKTCFTGNSSRHGQKGVCGVTMPAADFPCTADGVAPDIIINPHAIPSRMTIGMLMEMVLSKVACYEGETQDGTPFTGNNIELIADRLETHGMQRYGNEMLYNGMSGEILESMIFIAPCYYQRLKHMVVDKSHARNRGAQQLLTRAPTEGRSRDGGLRIGEMEKDSIISHGAGDVAKDRLFEQSDIFECVACEKCGHFAREGTDDTSVKNSGMWCEHCKTGEHCTHTQLPYSMKLLIQELAAAHISATLEF